MPVFRTVIFDCDSTLSRIEGVEALASEYRSEVAALTEAAMSGTVPLEEVYGRRLDLIQPTMADLERVGRQYVSERIPGVEDTVAALRREGVAVRVISGGLLQAVLVLTRFLGLPDKDVAAVEVHFDAAGRYHGFDEDSPLARAGGKEEVLRRWGRDTPGPTMLVGDGATDLEAKDAVDLFVAYAGVVSRPTVVAGADVVIEEQSLNRIVELALGQIPNQEVSQTTQTKKLST
jgi:phosphoserine phosphatase